MRACYIRTKDNRQPRHEFMRPDLVRRTTTTRLPTQEGTFQLSHYVDVRDGKEHLALAMGHVSDQHNVLVRVHSECFTGDVLGSQRCDCGEQLHEAMRSIAEEGNGIILYLRQEGRGIGLEQKLRAYNLQDQGYDTVDANLMLGHQADEREYSAAAAILADIRVRSIRLLTNNPDKIDHLEQLGVQINERLSLTSTVTKDNAAYLATKIQRMRHLLTMPLYTNGHSHDQGKDEPSSVTPIDLQLAILHEKIASRAATSHLPFVTLSYAQTLNGTIGSLTSERLLISGSESLIVTHKLRAQHDAILIGIGTLLADDPSLTVRLVEGQSPQPIIVDTHLRTPLHAKIWSHPKLPWIATQNTESSAAEALRNRGAKLIPLSQTPEGTLDLSALLANLGNVGIRSVMVEGGSAIISSMIDSRLTNYAVVTVAPRFVPGIAPVTSAISAIHDPAFTQAGNDMIIWGEIQWAAPTSSVPTAVIVTQNDLATPSTISPVI